MDVDLETVVGVVTFVEGREVVVAFVSAREVGVLVVVLGAEVGVEDTSSVAAPLGGEVVATP